MIIFKKIFIFSIFWIVPVWVFAQGIVTCEGPDCGFDDIINTIKAIIDWLLIMASVVAAGSFMYAGFLYLFSMGNQTKVSQAHEIFKKVLIGYIIMLSAWLIVHTIEQALDIQYESFLSLL